MPSFSLSPSKSKPKALKDKALKEGGGASPSQSPMRKFSGKLVKKVKRQLWRLDEALHHVTHTQHDPNAAPRSPPPVAKRKPPPVRERTHSLPAATFLRSVVPSSLRSSRSRDTWDVKYAKDRDSSDLFSCCSDDTHHSSPEDAVNAPLSADIIISEPEPPKVEVVETATASPLALVDDHYCDNLERSEEPNTFDTSIDLEPMPTCVEHQQYNPDVAGPLSPNAMQNGTQPTFKKDFYDEDELFMPCVRALVVPTTFSPLLPNMRHPFRFSTNLLTWWLCRTFYL